MTDASDITLPIVAKEKKPRKPRAKKVVESAPVEIAKAEEKAPPKAQKEKKPQTEKQKAAFEKCAAARKEKQAEKLRLKQEMNLAAAEAKAKVLSDRQKKEEEKSVKQLEKKVPKNIKAPKTPSKPEGIGQDGDAHGFIKSLRRLIEEEVVDRVRKNALVYEEDLAVEPLVRPPAPKRRRVVEPQGVRSRPTVAFI